MSDTKKIEVKTVVCVMCENHLRILGTLKPGELALLGYIDCNGDVQALSHAKLRKIHYGHNVDVTCDPPFCSDCGEEIDES